MPGVRDPLDEVRATLTAVVAGEPAGDDDLQVGKTRARQTVPFRDPVEDVGGVQVDRERSASPLGAR